MEEWVAMKCFNAEFVEWTICSEHDFVRRDKKWSEKETGPWSGAVSSRLVRR
jgi:hypothetical protein